jgi:hypothetical protein
MPRRRVDLPRLHLPATAPVAFVEERLLAEADPADHAPDGPVLLRHRVQDVEGAEADQPEVPGVERDLDVDRAIEDSVEEGGGDLLAEALPLAPGALAVDHVAAGVHALHHGAPELGGIPQVRVDEDPLSPADQQPRRQRQPVSVVARQVDADAVRVRSGEEEHHLPGAVPRAVVDQHDLVRVSRVSRRGLARPGQPAVQRVEALPLVETRDNRREPRPRRLDTHREHDPLRSTNAKDTLRLLRRSRTECARTILCVLAGLSSSNELAIPAPVGVDRSPKGRGQGEIFTRAVPWAGTALAV